MSKIKLGVLGSNGYVGYELVRLLLNHEAVEIKYLSSRTHKGKKYYELYPNLYGKIDLEFEDVNLEKCKELDLLFCATPQGFCASIINENLLKSTKIIDLSADFRIKNAKVYEQYYKIEHKAKDFLNEAVYGLCEIHRDKIKKARLIANPGCYTTCSILSLYPLVKENLIDKDFIIIDAKSGTSGAGKEAKLDSLFCEVNENIKAYGLKTHRHTPEIEQELSLALNDEVVLQFTPHLIPMQRGILSTSYVRLKEKISEEQVRAIYEKYYKDEYFVRLLPKDILPQSKFVRGSNYVDINISLDTRTNNLLVLASLDNLIKGAAGQAIQNMNILFNLDEKTGLQGLAEI